MPIYTVFLHPPSSLYLTLQTLQTLRTLSTLQTLSTFQTLLTLAKHQSTSL